jgi:hypothetical protein
MVVIRTRSARVTYDILACVFENDPVLLISTFAKLDMGQSWPQDKRSLGLVSSVENRRHEQQPTDVLEFHHSPQCIYITSSSSLPTTPLPNGQHNGDVEAVDGPPSSS